MGDIQTASVKYVFLDVVAFTKDRSVEAQSEIVEVLNRTVLDCLKNRSIASDKTILLPTGDGLCVALVEQPKPFDIHLLLAADILLAISKHNDSAKDEPRKFLVRMGLNENVDNLVIDINGKQNVAGMGISMAERIMGFADGGQILVSQAVFETLRARERYMNAFKKFEGRIKHGESIQVYQLINKNIATISDQTPGAFAEKVEPTPRLTKLEAFYLAHALRCYDFLVKRNDHGSFAYVATFMLYAMAHDSMAKASTHRHEKPNLVLWKTGEATLGQQHEYYDKTDIEVMIQFTDFFNAGRTTAFRQSFEGQTCLFVSEDGKKRLQNEHKEIWNEFFPSSAV